jgi:hypothetical protein
MLDGKQKKQNNNVRYLSTTASRVAESKREKE